MIKLIASDLDGTLVDNGNHICENNYMAIKSIQSKNIPFVVCTGKTYPIIKDVCSNFNANYGIFGNGNQIINLNTGEEIYKSTLTPEQVDTCLELAKKHNLHVHAYMNNEIVTEELMYMDLRNFELKERKTHSSSLTFNIVKDIKNYLTNKSSAICKLVISSFTSLDTVRTELLKNIDVEAMLICKRGEFKDKIIDKEYEYLDISPKGINKSTALSILGDYLKVDQSEMMAIGDNLNDLEMIKNTGIGIAMANGYDELKSVAKYTTTNPADKAGFAEAVYKFIEI